MSKIKVLIDSSIYIAWLNKKSEYSNIEKIRTFAENGKIEVVSSIEIRLEILNGSNGSADWKKIEKAFQPITHVLTPNCIIGDTNGSYKATLDKSKREWKNLSNLTKNPKDTKHFITGKDLGLVEYFLALDDRFFNAMKRQGANYLKNIQLVKPLELIHALKKPSCL